MCAIAHGLHIGILVPSSNVTSAATFGTPHTAHTRFALRPSGDSARCGSTAARCDSGSRSVARGWRSGTAGPGDNGLTGTAGGGMADGAAGGGILGNGTADGIAGVAFACGRFESASAIASAAETAPDGMRGGGDLVRSCAAGGGNTSGDLLAAGFTSLPRRATIGGLSGAEPRGDSLAGAIGSTSSGLGTRPYSEEGGAGTSGSVGTWPYAFSIGGTRSYIFRMVPPVAAVVAATAATVGGGGVDEGDDDDDSSVVAVALAAVGAATAVGGGAAASAAVETTGVASGMSLSFSTRGRKPP